MVIVLEMRKYWYGDSVGDEKETCNNPYVVLGALVCVIKITILKPNR